MTLRWIAWRIIREILRDRRTLAFLLLVPLVVMTLIYYAVAEDEQVEIGVLARGGARLFDVELIQAIESEDNVSVVPLAIDDEEVDRARIVAAIESQLRAHEVDAVLFLDQALIVDRFNGGPGTLHLYLEGSRATVTAGALEAISSAMDDLAASLPKVIDGSCSAFCADSVNNQPMELEKHYLYGSEDYRTVDYFLPVFPPFFVFFFTFILATVSFQRERLNGTLERLLIAPIGFGQIVAGYVGGFFVFTALQASIVLTYVLFLVSYSVDAAQLLSIALVTLLMMCIGLLLGLLASYLAHNEFQAVQFIPLVVLPQIFLSDMIWDIRGFPLPLQWLSIPLPLTHANAVMRDILLKHAPLWELWPGLLALSTFIGVILIALLRVGRRDPY